MARAPKAAKRPKVRRVRSAVSWLLMWRIIALPIALLAGLAVLSGISGNDDPVAADALLLAVFVPAAIVIFLLPLQRVVFAMRFESGPKLLDLPRKSHAFITAALICAPMLLFQTLTNHSYAARHGARDGAMAAALSDIVTASADRFTTESTRIDSTLTGEARRAAVDAWSSRIIAREAMEMIAQRRQVMEARRRFAALANHDDPNTRSLLGTLERLEQQMAFAPAPRVTDYGEIVSVSVDRSIYVSGDLCGSLDRLAQAGIATAAISPWAAPAPARRPAQCANSAGLAGPTSSTAAVMFTGVVGLLAFLSVALAAAIALRTARLSQSSGVVGGLALVLLFPLFMALIDFATVTLTGGGADLIVLWAFVGPVTIYAWLGSTGFAAAPGLRKDGWAGHFARMGLVSLPLVLVLLLLTTARLMAEFGASPTALFQLALAAPILFALAGWLGWDVLDRLMLRLNCAPVRETVARARAADETRAMGVRERIATVSGLLGTASAIAFTGRPPVLRANPVREAPVSNVNLSALSDWLLRRRAMTLLAIALCVIAIAAGLFAGAAWDTNLLPPAQNFAAIAVGLALVFLLQRPLTTMRFESGPRHLSLPNKVATFAIVTALIAPPFLLQSAAAALAVQSTPPNQGFYRAMTSVFEAADGVRWRSVDYTPADLADPAAMRRKFEAERARALSELFDARAVLAAKIADARPFTAADPEMQQQLTTFLAGVDEDITSLRAATARPEDGQDYQVLVRPDSFCSWGTLDGICEVYMQTLQQISMRTAFAPWAAPRDLPPAKSFYNQTLPGSLTGFVGLFGLIALGLIAAAAVRVVRLSEAPVVYLIAALVGGATVSTALITLAARAISADSYGADSGVYFTILLIAVPVFVAIGFIGQLRRETWGGYLLRLAVILFPAFAVVTFALNVREAPQIAIAAAPFALLIVGWAVWEFLDRWIVRANCRPNRVARGDAT